MTIPAEVSEKSSSSSAERGSGMFPAIPTVKPDEIVLREELGRGSYGTVFRAVWNKLTVAVKRIDDERKRKSFENEVKQLARVQHPKIISVFGIVRYSGFQGIIIEFAEGGSLHKFLHGDSKSKYTRAQALSWARQCAEGVAYLHSIKPKPLLHRDLKPDNLLLIKGGTLVKICDFGTVAEMKTEMTNDRGTAKYMAPEVFQDSIYNEKCDVYSWSIVLWEILSRRIPFEEFPNGITISWQTFLGKRPPLMADWPQSITDLMVSCWHKLPDARPTMQNVVEQLEAIIVGYPGSDLPISMADFKKEQILQPFVNLQEVLGKQLLNGKETLVKHVHSNAANLTQNLPVPILMLNHCNEEFRKFGIDFERYWVKVGTDTNANLKKFDNYCKKVGTDTNKNLKDFENYWHKVGADTKNNFQKFANWWNFKKKK